MGGDVEFKEQEEEKKKKRKKKKKKLLLENNCHAHTFGVEVLDCRHAAWCVCTASRLCTGFTNVSRDDRGGTRTSPTLFFFEPNSESGGFFCKTQNPEKDRARGDLWKRNGGGAAK